jgi:NAD(P)-dependent dehydrogenase (short-subunit alcohol dehydrogenase family)
MGREFVDMAVVVSGASRGIGRAITEAFAREGAQTVIAASSAANLAAAADGIASAVAFGRSPSPGIFARSTVARRFTPPVRTSSAAVTCWSARRSLRKSPARHA